ncbi:M48 family metallopeptidase [Candidatus Stoquefichus sp. SB1]|uniref:M48 family metallopeptidase n=1 Tax=Candidatus Stoquefichus sp. SB1 TaxID=1658109 RepID=UPI00067EF69C|nr:M48 family metallopeptidase [Candidatus Stoquefichus sp. SB1]
MRWLFLGLYTLSSLYSLFLLFLNHRQRRLKLPENIQDVYDLHEYQRWQAYEDETDRFSMIYQTVEFLFISFMILSPYYQWISALFPKNILMNSLLMMFITSIIEMLVQIPFQYYQIFVIEEKYHMNTTKLQLFIIDLLKENIMNMGLLTILFVFVHFFSLWFGYGGFVILFIMMIILVGFIQRYPLLIMKIFNTFTPLEDEDLKDNLTKLVEKYGFKLKGIYVTDASKRTKRANAFCCGAGKKKEICLDDNMLMHYQKDEILAVFAHEFGHAIYRHTEKLRWLNYIQMIAMFGIFLFVMMNQWLYADFGIGQMNYFMVLVIVSWLISLMTDCFTIVTSYYSRLCEYEADAFAVKEGYGELLIHLLKKLSRNGLSNIYPHPLVVKLSYSHPPLSQRIDAMERLIKQDE